MTNEEQADIIRRLINLRRRMIRLATRIRASERVVYNPQGMGRNLNIFSKS